MPDITTKFLEDMQSFVDAENVRLLAAFKDRDVVQRQLISWVLLFHLQAEQLLDRIIVARFPKAQKAIQGDQLRFYHKLQLVNWLDVVTDDVIQAVAALNTLRNRCSHDGGKTISIADLDGVGNWLEPYKEAKTDLGDDLFDVTRRVCMLVYAGLLGGVYKCEHPESMESLDEVDESGHEA